MGKVLISFLGTGRKDKNENSKRRYEPALYGIEGKTYEDSLIAHALMEHFAIDKIFLLGTVHSMWEEVYYKFAATIDEEYWEDLGLQCESATSETPLNSLDLSRVERSLGDGSHAILINYGLDKEQLDENTKNVMQIASYLQEGDELYVDITHGFRSLPLYIMNLLIYIKNLSDKNIQIKKICYGMFEAKTSDGVTPIVDLTSIIQINDWITGAYAFKEYGHGYQIASLLQDNRDIYNKLTTFSNAMNLNDYYKIIASSRELETIKGKFEDPISQFVVPPVIDSFKNKFNATKESKALLAITDWHFKHANYASAYLTIIQCILEFVCESCQFQVNEEMDKMECAKVVLGKTKTYLPNPEKVKDKYWGIVPSIDKLEAVYRAVNCIRNAIAHPKTNNPNELELRFKELCEMSNYKVENKGVIVEIKILGLSIDMLKKIIK